MRPLATFQVDRKIYFIDGTASDELLLRHASLPTPTHC